MLFLALPILAYCVGHVSSQSSITLWQFGANRLFPGSTTLPLIPIGTAGLGTTYLYEVADSLITEINGGTLVVEPTNPATRTIVASASGWFEAFSSNTIQCHFVDATSGECFDQTVTSSGPPIAHAIALATTPGPSDSTSIPAFTLTSSPSASSTPTVASPTAAPTIISPTAASAATTSESSRAKSVGAIVGGLIGGLLILCVLAVIFWLLRRQKAHKDVDLEKSTPGHRETSRHIISSKPLPKTPEHLKFDSKANTDDVGEMQLQRKAQLEELIHSLQTASIKAVQENNNHEQDLVLQNRLADLSERLRRLEEQGWVNEPLPDYA